MTNEITALQQYIYLKHQPIAKLEGKQLIAIHSDHLGTPRIATNDKKETVWKANYSPFGKATLETNKITLNLRLPGQYHDNETGTHYNYLRDYDPETGRYITSDPIGLKGGVNTYAYVGGDPLGLLDPLGLKASGRVIIRTAPTSAEVIAGAGVNAIIGTIVTLFNPSFTYNIVGGNYNEDNLIEVYKIREAYQLIEAIQKYDPSFAPSKPTQINFRSGIYSNLDIHLEVAVRVNLIQKSQIGFQYTTPNNIYTEDDIEQLNRVLQADRNGQCLALPKHTFVDTSAIEALLKTSNIFVSPEGVPYIDEIHYRVDKANFDNYKLNGGTRTFADWKASLDPGHRYIFHNRQPENLERELDTAERNGVKPIRPSDPEFADLIASGEKLIWVIDENGKLFFAPQIAPKYSEQINHSVLTGGAPVLSAGEANIVSDGAGGYVILEINHKSGHFRPSESSLHFAKEVFKNNGIRGGGF